MNAFDSDNFATVEPEVLTIGDRWVWKRTDLGTDYPPSSYALSYSARLQGAGSTAISITASESGDDYLVIRICYKCKLHRRYLLLVCLHY